MDYSLSEKSEIILTKGAEINYDEFELKCVKPCAQNFYFIKFKNEKTHKWNHLFYCLEEDCCRFFLKWSYLLDHLRSHSGDKPFICPQIDCERPFSQKFNMKRHLQSCHPKKELQCYACLATFKSHSKIYKHKCQE
mmetsp:Transcript_19428/g.18540  ORF Transcript_19428/g.18540 Transcript_19428/m.18540 type:complete len:136 (-) Transcript_19428:322-729(-)